MPQHPSGEGAPWSAQHYPRDKADGRDQMRAGVQHARELLDERGAESARDVCSVQADDHPGGDGGDHGEGEGAPPRMPPYKQHGHRGHADDDDGREGIAGERDQSSWSQQDHGDSNDDGRSAQKRGRTTGASCGISEQAHGNAGEADSDADARVNGIGHHTSGEPGSDVLHPAE